MNKVCRDVRDKFVLYEQLLLGPKATQGGDIYVHEPKASRADWQVNKRHVEQLAQDEDYRSELHTEVKSNEHPRFKFLLFAHEFMSTPLANYDSLGATHRNKFDYIPLAEQWVTTPHFNRYNEQGVRIAYKTPPLTNAEALSQLASATNCVILFYEEFQISHLTAGYPAVIMRAAQQDLFSESLDDDPLAYVTQF
jgi:hypothetical protein